jgi:hypothetical protein
MPNANKQMVDLPFFELCNQAPVATSALSAITTVEDGTDRYIYYMSGSSFYRYDTVADTFQQLATPPVAPLTAMSMRYTRFRGFHGRVLAAGATSVTIPGLRGGALDQSTLRIQFGTGAGQDRVLTYTGETIHDAGVVTAVTALALTDALKKWRVNQWAGYLVGITFGTAATQYKKVLYNDATTLYVADANLQPHDPWNNQAYVAAAPYALPVVTAGSQAHYQIMSSTFTVPAWTVVPDDTSFFTAITGGIYLVSSAAAAPFYTLQYYDVAHDSWQVKTAPQSLIGAALGTDFCIERTSKIGAAFVTSTATSGANRTLTDTAQTLEVGRYNNHRIYITGGTGRGQNRRIVNHTASQFTVARNWDTNPDATTTYEVWPDADRMYMVGGAAAAMFAYSPENDYWMQGQSFDDGITANITATMKGWVPLGVSTGVRIAAGVQAINPVPTAGGTLYQVGEILTCAVGGAGAQAIVTSIGSGGVVTGLALIHSGTGTGYAVGTGKATTASASGTGCTIEVTAIGPTALVTTATAHWLRTGNAVTFAGCSEGLWNAQHTILGVNSTTSFSVAITATANMAATASQSVTTIVDPSKNWVVNEHVGRLVHLMVAGTAPTSQIRWVISNTANTLTVATIVAGANGTSKYVIYDSKVFGIEDQRKETGMSGDGQATGGSTTTLIDTSKNWVPGQWVGYVFKVEAGTGYGSGRISVTANSANTLTFSVQSFTPDATTRYEIADTWGLCTAGGTTTPVTEATTKNWAVNQFAGKRFRTTGGTAPGQETSVTSNTATAITSGALTATDATTTYAIVSIPPRAAGIDLIWAWGATDVKKKGRFIYSPRGGASNTLDVYDISKGKWGFGLHFDPQAEPFNTGSSYTYDGADNVILSRSVASNPIRCFQLNVNTGKVSGLATTTMLQNAVHIGHNIEIVDSADGYSYLYCLQNAGTQLSRALLF